MGIIRLRVIMTHYHTQQKAFFFSNSTPHRLSKLLQWNQVSICSVHITCPAAPGLSNSVSLSLFIDHFCPLLALHVQAPDDITARLQSGGQGSFLNYD